MTLLKRIALAIVDTGLTFVSAIDVFFEIALTFAALGSLCACDLARTLLEDLRKKVR